MNQEGCKEGNDIRVGFGPDQAVTQGGHIVVESTVK